MKLTLTLKILTIEKKTCDSQISYLFIEPIQDE